LTFCLLVCLFASEPKKMPDHEQVLFCNGYLFESIDKVEDIMRQSFKKMNTENSVFVVRKNLKNSITSKYSEQADLIQTKLNDLSVGWTYRRSYSYDLLSLVIDNLINEAEPKFEFLDDDNIFRLFLLCNEEHQLRPIKKKNSKSSKQSSDDLKKKQNRSNCIEMINSMVAELKRANSPPPPLPCLSETDELRIFATLLGRTFASEVKKNLYLNFLKYQKICLNEILKHRLAQSNIKYNFDSFQCLSLDLRKIINEWSFTSTKSDILKVNNFDDLISEFKSIRPQITADSGFGLTKRQLKSLSKSQLFGFLRSLVLLVRKSCNREFHLRLVPKTSNSIISLPFDHKAFQAVFPKILKDPKVELFDVFDRLSFKRSQCICDGYFRTNGINISMTFHRSGLIPNQIKLSKELPIRAQSQSQKSILKMMIIILWLISPVPTEPKKWVFD
jgi:hypothetical protein